MAARQADLMSEYLCLYRVLEAADNTNGVTFARGRIPEIRAYDFGRLPVVDEFARDDRVEVNAFEVYRDRALDEIEELAVIDEISDLPRYLYDIRNSLAHGKQVPLVTGRGGDSFMRAARALVIVKLLARMAVEDCPVT